MTEIITKIKCKNCGSEAVVKYGSYKGVQRYFCKSCKRKFKAGESAFHGKVPASYVSRAVAEYYSGMSINDIRLLLKQEYGYYPSKSIVFKWVNKYTDLASEHFKDYHPEVGSTWIADETMLDLDGEHKVWLYDIIDERTRFLLATRVALSRTRLDASMLMREACKRAGGVIPKAIITDQNNSYLDGIELTFGSDVEHVQGKPFALKATKQSTSLIERFHSTLKDRTKVIRAFRDVETLIQFTQGWLTYYNFFKPHQSLDGKTPAEVAHLKYDVKNWADLARQPVAKETEILSHKLPKIKLPRVKTNLESALRRHRAPKQSRAKRGGIFVSKEGAMSRHYFRGARRVG